MIWHDCKSDPPKESGKYLLCSLLSDKEKNLDWAEYSIAEDLWENEFHFGLYSHYWTPYKWAEVELPK